VLMACPPERSRDDEDDHENCGRIAYPISRREVSEYGFL
jgi:hypothetical protein